MNRLPAYKLCLLCYPLAGNGPWNYFYESPPADCVTVYQLGYYIGKEESHHLIASEIYADKEGNFHPIRVQHYSLDVDLTFL